MTYRRRGRRPMVAAAGLLLGVCAAAGAAEPTAVERGKYLFHAALCEVCHTAEDGKFLAGGRPLPSPFGTFYSPNITPDPRTGIGAWSEEEFVRALRDGVAPDGRHYYPAFPYTAYTRLRRQDMLAIKAYLDTVEPIDQPNRDHDLSWYASWRKPIGLWKWLYFEPGEFQPDPARDAAWNRGAYLAKAAAHCAECHTPRNILGALDPDLRYSGAKDGPEGETTPNITPHKKQGIGTWTVSMLSFYLEIGMDPKGDFAGSLMAKVIDKGTGKLTAEDRDAIATYLLSLPAIPAQK